MLLPVYCTGGIVAEPAYYSGGHTCAPNVPGTTLPHIPVENKTRVLNHLWNDISHRTHPRFLSQQRRMDRNPRLDCRRLVVKQMEIIS